VRATVFCSPHWSALQEKALSIWMDAWCENASPILIVPTTAMRSHWLSLIASEVKGVSGDSVSVLDLLAYRLAASCSDELFRLAFPVEQKLAAITARHELKLPDKWKGSGVVDVFLNAVEELELHELSPEAVQDALSGDETAQVLVQWWREWKGVLKRHGLWSLGDALKLAVECLRRRKAAVPKAKTVIVYGFTALTSARWNFLKTLLENLSPDDLTVYFFIPANTENRSAYGYAQPLINRLRDELGAEVCHLQSTLPEEFRSLPTLLFRWHQPKGEQKPTERIVYVATAGEEQEVEMAVRLLVHWLRTGKLKRFSDALLVAQSLEPYLPALEAVGARCNLPFVVLDRAVRPHTGLANLLSSIWNARRSNWDGESLWQVLPSPYLRHPSNPETPLLPGEKHKDLLAFVRQRLAERGSKRWVELLSGAFGDGNFVKPVADFFDAVDKLPSNASVSEHARCWQDVLRFVHPIDERDKRTLENLRKQLNAFKVWSAEVSGDEFVEVLVKSCLEDVNEFRDAVRVASVSDARGLVAPVVVLLGMADGRFPPSPLVFELLTDKHREVLTTKLGLKTSLRFHRRPKGGKFDFVTSFAQEQRMLFAEMLGIATERLVFTHPKTDPDGKPVARSLFLDEVEDALKAAGFVWLKEERDLSDVVLPKQSSGQGALPEGLGQALDPHEASVSAMFYAFTGHASLTGVDRAIVGENLRDENLRERLLTEWKRWFEPQEGRWDGKGLKIAPRNLASRWKELRLKVTALEEYGHCPYQFFARNVLRLSRPYEVTYFVDPATLGDLWHRIIAEFLKTFRESQEFPEKQVLEQVARKVFENHQQVQQAPQQVRQLLWERIEATLPSVWGAEKAQAADGWMPVRVEEEIALPAVALGDVPQDWSDLKLVMRPDRVDRNKKGEVRIADYKTGKVSSQTHIRSGVALQLPLYALALRNEGEEVSKALFLRLLSFKSSRSYKTGCQLGSEIGDKQKLTLSEAICIAQRHARQYLHKIAQSDFTVLPFSLSESCRSCDFKVLCRRHPLRLKERRAGEEVEGEDYGASDGF